MQFAIGNWLLEGKMLDKDEEKAVLMLEKAASQGHPRALFLLGNCYEGGVGVKTNFHRASDMYQVCVFCIPLQCTPKEFLVHCCICANTR